MGRRQGYRLHLDLLSFVTQRLEVSQECDTQPLGRLQKVRVVTND
jgi:hypothetical protein